MANVLVNEAVLGGVADYIRERKGTSETFLPGEFVTELNALPAGAAGGSIIFNGPYIIEPSKAMFGTPNTTVGFDIRIPEQDLGTFIMEISENYIFNVGRIKYDPDSYWLEFFEGVPEGEPAGTGYSAWHPSEGWNPGTGRIKFQGYSCPPELATFITLSDISHTLIQWRFNTPTNRYVRIIYLNNNGLWTSERVDSESVISAVAGAPIIIEYTEEAWLDRSSSESEGCYFITDTVVMAGLQYLGTGYWGSDPTLLFTAGGP